MKSEISKTQYEIHSVPLCLSPFAPTDLTNYNIFPTHPFMQNKPNFLHFSPKNTCLTKNKANSNPIQTQFKPKQTQFKPNFLSEYTTLKGANMSKGEKMIAFAWIGILQ
jgi:hypothetical protein